MRAVNLLTPELRSSQKGSGAPRQSPLTTSGGLGAFVVLGALALIVAGVAGYVLSTNVIKEKQASLTEAEAQNAAAAKRAAELKPYADFQTMAQERVSTVQALASARFDWEQSLRDLSRAVPSNVYLSSLRGTVGGGEGGGGSGIRGAISSPAIELSGCTKSQPGVARLMSRLRNVQGVTRVSLSKSEKTGTAANSAAGSEVGPCGKGSPPNFEVVVFFEKATVGTALANATGTAPAAGSSEEKPDDSAAQPSSTPAAQGGSTP